MSQRSARWECRKRDNNQIGGYQETVNSDPMVIQKTLHVNQTLEECKTHSSEHSIVRRHFAMVPKATITSSKAVDSVFADRWALKVGLSCCRLKANRPIKWRLNP